MTEEDRERWERCVRGLVDKHGLPDTVVEEIMTTGLSFATAAED